MKYEHSLMTNEDEFDYASEYNQYGSVNGAYGAMIAYPATNALFLGDLHEFTDDQLLDHLVSNYTADREELRGFEFLIAYESVGSYGCDSNSFFVLKKGEDFYVNSGSHCSCYGFEGQWGPSKVTRKYLLSDKFSFNTGGYDDDAAANTEAVKAHLAQYFHSKWAGSEPNPALARAVASPDADRLTPTGRVLTKSAMPQPSPATPTVTPFSKPFGAKIKIPKPDEFNPGRAAKIKAQLNEEAQPVIEKILTEMNKLAEPIDTIPVSLRVEVPSKLATTVCDEFMAQGWELVVNTLTKGCTICMHRTREIDLNEGNRG